MNHEDKQALKAFLDTQRAYALATVDEQGMPYISNIYMGADDNLQVFFISSKETAHSKHILKNENVAVSTIWYNPSDYTDRKGIQARGTCILADKDQQIKTGVRLHNTYFPQFAHRITEDWIKEGNSAVWMITLSAVKYWDDARYGDEEFEEFDLRNTHN